MKFTMGNGFFVAGLSLAVVCCQLTHARQLNKRVAFHEGKISVELPDGWKESEQNKGAANLLAGFESSDQRSSVFFTRAVAGQESGMTDVMDSSIKDFEAAFDVKEVSEYKTGRVQGPNDKWPAVYATMELEMKTNRDPVPFRFYVMIFDTGAGLYMIQGSTMKPVRDVREKEIIRMLKSVIATR